MFLNPAPQSCTIENTRGSGMRSAHLSPDVGAFPLLTRASPVAQYRICSQATSTTGISLARARTEVQIRQSTTWEVPFETPRQTNSRNMAGLRHRKESGPGDYHLISNLSVTGPLMEQSC